MIILPEKNPPVVPAVKPSSEIEKLPEEVIKNLTVPEGVKVDPLSEEVIKNLTVPQ